MHHQPDLIQPETSNSQSRTSHDDKKPNDHIPRLLRQHPQVLLRGVVADDEAGRARVSPAQPIALFVHVENIIHKSRVIEHGDFFAGLQRLRLEPAGVVPVLAAPLDFVGFQASHGAVAGQTLRPAALVVAPALLPIDH